jgi:hypothetical protein
MLSRTDLPKFAANSIDKGTPDENAMAMRGAFGHFGAYIYDPATKTLTTVQEAATQRHRRAHHAQGHRAHRRTALHQSLDGCERRGRSHLPSREIALTNHPQGCVMKA